MGIRKGEALRFLTEVVFKYEGDECLVWPYHRNYGGYGSLRIKSKAYLVSRLACDERNGPPPTAKHQAAHSCGKGHEGCCTKRHLSWKTPRENSADAIAHGAVARADRLPQTKLTPSQIIEIRSLVLPQKQIAIRFGVHPTTISKIQSRDEWAWVKEA